MKIFLLLALISQIASAQASCSQLRLRGKISVKDGAPIITVNEKTKSEKVFYFPKDFIQFASLYSKFSVKGLFVFADADPVSKSKILEFGTLDEDVPNPLHPRGYEFIKKVDCPKETK